MPLAGHTCTVGSIHGETKSWSDSGNSFPPLSAYIVLYAKYAADIFQKTTVLCGISNQKMYGLKVLYVYSIKRGVI